MMKIIEEIGKAQRLINVQKTEYNAFGKYKYRNAESILAAVKKVLSPEITLIPEYEISEDEKRLVLTLNFSMNDEKYQHKSVVFLDKHKGMSNEQCVGAAYSYCLKYALCAIFLIDNEEDADKLPPKSETLQKSKAEQVYQRALKALKECNSVSEMLTKKADMVAKMPEYQADISRAYDTAVQDLDALNEQNEQAAQSHNDDDCPF